MNKQVQNKIEEIKSKHGDKFEKEAFIKTGLEYVVSIDDDVKKQVAVLNEMIETLNGWDGREDDRVGIIVDINPDTGEADEEQERKETKKRAVPGGVTEDDLNIDDIRKALKKSEKLEKEGKTDEAIKELEALAKQLTGGALSVDNMDKVIEFMKPRLAKLMTDTDDFVESLGFKGDDVWRMSFATLQFLVERAENNIKRGHKPR